MAAGLCGWQCWAVVERSVQLSVIWEIQVQDPVWEHCFTLLILKLTGNKVSAIFLLPVYSRCARICQRSRWPNADRQDWKPRCRLALGVLSTCGYRCLSPRPRDERWSQMMHCGRDTDRQVILLLLWQLWLHTFQTQTHECLTYCKIKKTTVYHFFFVLFL